MKREAETRLRNLIKNSNGSVIIVEGARQVGKSYFVNDVLRGLDKPFFVFDLEKFPILRRQIDKTEDFTDFRYLMEDQYGLKRDSILFIDEAQESRQLAKYVKSFKEDLPDIQVILTGSSMNRFFSKDVRIPVGRFRSICLFGFNFSEFVEYIRGEKLADYLRSSPADVPASRHSLFLGLYDEYMKIGGYPEAVIAHAEKGDSFVVIDEIMASLEEDFERKEEYQPELFRDTINAIANHIGSPSKYTHFTTTKYHAKNIISALRTWHIALEVEPKSINPDKGGVFLPKRYLHDIGVVNRRRSSAIPSISILETLDPLLRTPLGGLFENSLLIQLLSGESAFHRVRTWKKGTQTDIEVDFVYDLPEIGISVPIECKAAMQVKKKHYRNLVHYLEITNQTYGILVSAAPYQVITAGLKTIINIPIYLVSKQNIKMYIQAVK
jgi:uncharacterized protein